MSRIWWQCRREITLVDFRVPHIPLQMLPQPTHVLPGTEPGNVGFEFVLHREETRLRNVMSG